MLLLLILFVVLSAWVTIAARRRRGRDSVALGWMSEQWLLEYRASHSA